MRVPLGRRLLIRIAGWIVPSRLRSTWLADRYAELFDWWYLVERGEPVRDGGAAICRRAFADAFSERLAGRDPRLIVRAPMFVPIAAVASLMALALVSHGFAVTRAIVAVARDMHDNPGHAGYDGRGDRVFVFAAPILLAISTGLTMLGLGCLSLRGRGWRYWGFLALKAVAVAVIFPLVWMEVGTALRIHIASKGWRVTFGIATAVFLLVATGRAMIWCIADQRRRCRVCLRRLVLPVSVGSWASLFEPSATEMLCEDGHGALALSDAETNVQDRWTRLDDSWKALFH
jgi:hypothetical protein